MKISLKFSYKDDIRRVSLDHRPTLPEIVGIVKKMFSLENFVLKYMDEDHDEVTIGSEDELDQAIDLSLKNSLLRIFVKPVVVNNNSFAGFDNQGGKNGEGGIEHSLPNVLSNQDMINMITSSVFAQIQPYIEQFNSASQLLTQSVLNNQQANFINQPIGNSPSPHLLSHPPNDKQQPVIDGNIVNDSGNVNGNNNIIKEDDDGHQIGGEDHFQPKEVKCSYSFSRHYTHDDFSRCEEGSEIMKTWLLENDGDVKWPEGSYIKIISSDAPMSDRTTYPIPLANPGDQIPVEFPLRIPKPGRYITYYRLYLPDDKPMKGPRIWSDLISVPSGSPLPSPNNHISPQPLSPQPQPQPQPQPPVPFHKIIQEEIPAAWEESLAVLMEMGYDRPFLIPFLKKANGDATAALELILS